MPDEAYRACLEREGEYEMYFPVAGASNKGAYRFSRENVQFVVGMDDDMGMYSTFIGFSVVKHIDMAIIDVMGALLKNRNIPYHQDFTYASGYEELVFAPRMTADYFLDISDIEKRIVEIEQSYEESYK